jgi:hypothetical protein
MGHECASDEQVAADVERYGLCVMLIKEGDEGPKFAYSVGLYHNYDHPEIIVFGLNHDVAHWVINELARRIKAGRRCQIGQQYRGLLEGYSCVFREVPKACYPDYFGYAMSFYRGDDFPALQLVWPDKQHRWPWEDDFNPHWIWQQPLLERWPGVKAKSRWKFSEPRNLGVFTTVPVLHHGLPILHVVHEEDGDWEFLCGTTVEPDQIKLVCLKDVAELDPSVNDLADLPPGWRAWRESQGASWQRELLSGSAEE